MTAEIVANKPVYLPTGEKPSLAEKTTPNLLGVPEVEGFVRFLEDTCRPRDAVAVVPLRDVEDVSEFLEGFEKWGAAVGEVIDVSESSLERFRRVATADHRAASTRRTKWDAASLADTRRLSTRTTRLSNRFDKASGRFAEAYDRAKHNALTILSKMQRRNLGETNLEDNSEHPFGRRVVYAGTAVGVGVATISPVIAPNAETRTVEQVGLEERQIIGKPQTAQELFKQIQENGFNLTDLNNQMALWLDSQEAQEQASGAFELPKAVLAERFGAPLSQVASDETTRQRFEEWVGGDTEHQDLVDSLRNLANVRIIPSGVNPENLFIVTYYAEDSSGNIIATGVIMETIATAEGYVPSRFFFSDEKTGELPSMDASMPLEVAKLEGSDGEERFVLVISSSDGERQVVLGNFDYSTSQATAYELPEGSSLSQEGIIGGIMRLNGNTEIQTAGTVRVGNEQRPQVGGIENPPAEDAEVFVGVSEAFEPIIHEYPGGSPDALFISAEQEGIKITGWNPHIHAFEGIKNGETLYFFPGLGTRGRVGEETRNRDDLTDGWTRYGGLITSTNFQPEVSGMELHVFTSQNFLYQGQPHRLEWRDDLASNQNSIDYLTERLISEFPNLRGRQVHIILIGDDVTAIGRDASTVASSFARLGNGFRMGWDGAYAAGAELFGNTFLLRVSQSGNGLSADMLGANSFLDPFTALVRDRYDSWGPDALNAAREVLDRVSADVYRVSGGRTYGWFLSAKPAQ